MDRVTKDQLVNLVGEYQRTWEAMGFPMTFILDVGIPSAGVCWRLRIKETGSNAPGTSDGYLGVTKSEAWDTLQTIIRTLRDFSYLRQIESERE